MVSGSDFQTEGGGSNFGLCYPDPGCLKDG